MDHQRLAYFNLVLGIRFLGVGGDAIKIAIPSPTPLAYVASQQLSACIGTLAHSKCAIKLRYLDVALAHFETQKTRY